ncbi:MAG: 4Fe-4S dicluster domain-containing protein [Acidobacteriota bacterium]
MTELAPIPFVDLVRRMRHEMASCRAIFDLPVKKWWMPNPAIDLGAIHFGRRAATPVGPAAGPHTQLAQNIVLSWLAGSRIIELKTVQINDQLELPRPCIHVPNVGYNVEWSQELRVEQSLGEYVKACFLIEILKATRGFGAFDAGISTKCFDVIYDISVGYDLEGIQSEKVTGFIRALQDPKSHFDVLRRELERAPDLAEFADLELPVTLSDCVTLSTFHGCPADQIERIARYLIDELELHTIIKLNPTLLGFDTVREILHQRLGYIHQELIREAFEMDLQYEDGLAILHRLKELAERHGSTIGAKFTNTLVVANRKELFPTQTDPYMYLSGQPLHVIAMTLMQRFREDLGFELPVSFSAGIDARNFPTAVACGMVPVTTCTDLLRQGGYGRLPGYLKALTKAMSKAGVDSREAYVLAAGSHGAEAVEQVLKTHAPELWARQGTELQRIAIDEPSQLPVALRRAAESEPTLDREVLVTHALRTAGRLNGRQLVPPIAEDPRYHSDRNQKTPRRIDSTLELYDCVNCDLCISACPNDAIFAYDVEPTTVETERLTNDDAGGLQRAKGDGFVIAERHQLAVLEGACNECSNCEVYCPELGAPFVIKERVFHSAESFTGASHLDGFYRDGAALRARINGLELKFQPVPEGNSATVTGEGLHLELSWQPFEVRKAQLGQHAQDLDTAVLWRMRRAWESIFTGPIPSMVHPSALANEPA